MTEAPRRSRSRSANTTPRMAPMAPQQAPMPGAPMPGAPMPGGPMPGAPMPGTPPQMQGYPNNMHPQMAAANQAAAAAQQQQGANHPPMPEGGPGYPSTPYMQQQGQQQSGEQRGLFSGFRRRMREAAGFIHTDPYSERGYGQQMMGGGQPQMMGTPMQPGYGNGAGSPGVYGGGQYGQQPHVPGQPQMMQQQYMQHSPQYMGGSANHYGYSQTPGMMQQQQPYGGMAYGYGASPGGYYNRGSYGGSYSPYAGAYGNAYGSSAYGAYGGAGAYGGGYGSYGGGGGGYGMGSYPYSSYGYGAGGYGGGGYGGNYMGYPRHMPIYDEHGKRIYPQENYVSSVKDLWSSDLL